MYRVADLVEDFDGFKVLAGHAGIEDEIKTVSVMDAPDIYLWMRGGEFLMTTAYIMRDDPKSLENLIIELRKHGATALGVKRDRFIMDLPGVVKDTADRLGFPVVYVPNSYSFTDVINPVLSHIVNNQARKLLKSEQLHKSFTKMVIDGKNNEDILGEVHQLIESDVAFVDTILDRIYIKSESESFIEDMQTEGIRDILGKYYYYVLEIGDSVYGYIVLNRTGEFRETDSLEQITIEHASTVLKLNIQREISKRQIEAKYKNEFIQDLILNNIDNAEEIMNRARNYNWKMEKGIVCLIIDVLGLKKRFTVGQDLRKLEEDRDKLFIRIVDYVRKYNRECHYTTYSDNIVFLVVPGENKEYDFFPHLNEVSSRLIRKFKEEENFDIRVGIGSHRDLLDAHVSYEEARKAVLISRKLQNPGELYSYKDLGVYRILSDLTELSEAQAYCDQVLGGLRTHDQEHGCDYLGTLKALIQNDWNLKKTSETMFIHYNTMKYRFQKISEVLGLNLNQREEKFKVELCLKLWNLKE
jgi:purine catabolism regulator